MELNTFEDRKNGIQYSHITRYIELYPHMREEELPIEMNSFCEYIIQQSARQANVYFTQNPDVVASFLEYFTDATDEVFYRGGYPNTDRVLLCSSTSRDVALSFSFDGTVMTMKPEKYYVVEESCFDEEEVILWKAEIVKC